ncbi:MAG: FliM/FliN family flagellar motor switch protein [Phycisphaerae bacterium]
MVIDQDEMNALKSQGAGGETGDAVTASTGESAAVATSTGGAAGETVAAGPRGSNRAGRPGALRDSRPRTTPKVAADADRILKIRVPVIAQLAERTMPIADIRRMSSGSVIKFATSADGDLELCINNHAIAQGIAVRVGERFGLRITRVGTPEERIRSLGR